MQACIAHTRTHTETKGKSSLRKECIYHKNEMHLFWLCVCLSTDCFMLHTHPHILISSLISIITLGVLLCHFIPFKAPHWHPDKCIGHLTHAPHVSEYISNTVISSRPLKHHVPHGAVWVGGLNIYQWISSLKCHLAFNTKPILYFMSKCQFSTLMFYVSSQWLLSVKRQQPLSQDIDIYFLKLLACLALS